MDLTVASTYLKFKDDFTSIEDYLAFLVQTSKIEPIVYYKSRPDEVFEAGDTLIVAADQVDRAYESLENPVIEDDEEWEFEEGNVSSRKEDVFFSSEEVLKYFIPRKIYLNLEELKQLFEKNRFQLVEYISSNEPSISTVILKVRDVLPLEEGIVSFSELLVDSSLFSSLKSASKESLMLKRCINPANNYRSAIILLEGKEDNEPYNENQALILKHLYEGTLESPGYALSYDDIRQIVSDFKLRADDSIKPSSVFKDKMILEFLKSQNKCYIFKLPKE